MNKLQKLHARKVRLKLRYLQTELEETKLIYKDSLEKLKAIIEGNGGQMFIIGHHQAHAANAFFSSNHDEALVFTMDGGGMESDTGFITAFTVWQGKGNKISHIKFNNLLSNLFFLLNFYF